MSIVNLYTKIVVNHSRNSRGWGQARGGRGGFESGGESHIGTLECHVTSSPPHSQGD
jgi:hypothetical protein